MTSKHFILVFISCIILSSCEQFLEVELPGQETRLVLNALLEQTDTLKVYLTKSKGILESQDFNEEFDLVDGARVVIKDQDGQITPMAYLDKSNILEANAYYYLNGYKLSAGHTYEIIAERENYPTIKSSQLFPHPIQIKSLDLRNLGPSERLENYIDYEVTVKFDDPLENNFYEISGTILVRDSIIHEGEKLLNIYQTGINPSPVNPAYQKDFSNRHVILFDDALLNGLDSELVFRMSLQNATNIEATVKFSHVSESYYRYYETADLQRSNSEDILSQPVLVYNNITNGMGIFKARNSDQMVIEIAKKE